MKYKVKSLLKNSILALVCVAFFTVGILSLTQNNKNQTAYAVENTGKAIAGGNFATTEKIWTQGVETSSNLIPTPSLPDLNKDAGQDKEAWQQNWNTVMVPAGWGSKWISGADDALQVYVPDGGNHIYAIRPVDAGMTGSNACLGGAGSAPNKYTGGVSYTVQLTGKDTALANAGKLKFSANAEFYREENKYYYQAITVEFFDDGGDLIQTEQKKWSATILGGSSNGYLARSFSSKLVPSETKFIRFWFSNNGSGDARKSVADMEAYLIDLTNHTEHTLKNGVCACGYVRYDLWVGDTRITTDNEKDIDPTNNPGKIFYDAENNVLTLNNATITYVYDNLFANYPNIYALGDLTINLVGSNKAYFNTYSNPIYCNGGVLTLTGAGSLYVSSGYTAVCADGVIADNFKILASADISAEISTLAEGATFDTENKLYKYNGSHVKTIYFQAPHTHCSCGAVLCENIGTAGHGEIIYTQLTQEILNGFNGEFPAGNYCLADNLTANKDLSVISGATVNLCLNGKTLDLGDYRIVVDNGETLTVCDCNVQEYWGTIISAYINEHSAAPVIYCSGTFNLNSGKIITASTLNATGISINSTGNVNIIGGYVGGGDCGINVRGGELIVTDGRIEGSSSGIENYAKTSVTGGEITGKSGIIVGVNTTLYLYSSPSINGTDSTYADIFSNSGAIYATNTDGTSVYEGKALTVMVNSAYAQTDLKVIQNVTAGDGGNIEKFQLVNTTGYGMKLGSGDNADDLVLADGHIHENKEFIELTQTMLDSLTDGTIPAGNYYLSANLTATKKLTTSGDVDICLNGYTLSMSYYSLSINSGNTLSVRDCKESGKVTALDSNNATLIYNDNGVFNLYGGTLEGTQKMAYAVIYATNAGEINIYGGTINAKLCAIYNEMGSTLYVHGGTIIGNSSIGGTIRIYGTSEKNSTAYITGGYIIGTGCAVLSYENSSIHISGNPTITVTEGTAVVLKGNGNTISGGTIIGYSNGIHNYDVATTTILGGTITGNINGINNDGKLIIVDGNISATEQYGVRNNNGGTVAISGGTISSINSYGLYNSGNLTISNGTITSTNLYGLYNAENGKSYLSGTPTISGASDYADIYFKNGSIYAESNDHTPLPYSGNDLTVYVDNLTATVIINDVTEDNKNKFSLTNSGYSLLLGGADNPQNDLVLHAHAYTVKYDETNHWNECSCGEKQGVTAHSIVNADNNCTTDEKCSCGKVIVAKNEYHSYAYSASDNVITETCSAEGCTIHTATATIVKPEGTLTYNGNEFTATVTYSTGWAGGTLTLVYKMNGYETSNLKTAGNYVASITIDTDKTATVSYTIKPAKVAKPTADTTVYTYNGQQQTYNVVRMEGIYNVINDTMTDAGSQEVTVRLINSQNYEWEDGTGTWLTFTFTINKATVEVPTISSKVYTGETLTADIGDNNDYTVKTNVGGKAVGQYDVILELTDSANYKWATTENAQVTVKFNITKATNAFTSAPTISGWTYGETASTPTGTATFGTITYTYYDSNKELLDNKPTNAGSYYMKASVSKDGDNYDAISTDFIPFTIAKASLYVTANNNTITYGDAPSANGVLYNGFVNNETESVLGGTLAFEFDYDRYDDVGINYTITPKGLTADNYNITFVHGRLVVNQKEVGINWSTLNASALVYNSSQKILTATLTGGVNGDVITADTTLYSGDNVSVTADGFRFKIASILGENSANYTLPDSIYSPVYLITKATYDMSAITFNNGVFTYSGNANSIYINGELPTGVSVQYANNGVINATESAVTVTASFTGDSVNYNAIQPLTATIIVNKADAVITVDTTPIVVVYGNAIIIPQASSSYGTVVCDKEQSDLTEVGVYTLTYTVAEGDNYNGAIVTVSVTINQAEMIDHLGEQTQTPNVIVSTPSGFAPNEKVVITEIAIESEQTGGVKENEKIEAVYNISLEADGTAIEPNGNITVKIYIPTALKEKEFKIIRNIQGGYTEMDYIISGDYAVFTVNQLAEFMFVCDDTANLGWLIGTLAGIIALEIAGGIFLALKIKKKGGKFNKPTGGILTAMLSALFFKGSYVAPNTIVTLSILGALALIIGALDVYLGVKVTKKQPIAPSQPVITQRINIPKEQTLVQAEPILQVNEPDVLQLSDNQIMVNYNRSFMAKLIQSAEDTKQFYATIKNYLLSFKGIKSRISWKAETFNLGRKQIAKLNIKGKTLNIYLALNPADYLNVNFKVQDNSASATYFKVPLGYKVKSNRGVKVAIKLIDDIVNALALAKLEKVNAVSASDYPYQDTKVLLEQGLIKVKAVNGEEINGKDLIAKPFNIRQSVTVTQAQAELTDEVALTLVVRQGAIKSSGKKYPVNIDVLSNNFTAGERLDIDALKLKGIVPKSEKAIKILARGSIDKPLTVIADSYSADAIKMIVLVGGTAMLK